jgi:hypothetical protein
VLVSKEPLEPIRRQGGVPGRVLNIPVAEVGLKRAGIDPVIGELKTRGAPQHMGMGLDAKLGRDTGPFDHAGEARRCQGRLAFTDEDKGRFRALALMLAQCSEFPACDGVCAGRAVLDAPDVQGSRFKVDLLPTKVNDLGRSEAMPIGQKHH